MKHITFCWNLLLAQYSITCLELSFIITLSMIQKKKKFMDLIFYLKLDSNELDITG